MRNTQWPLLLGFCIALGWATTASACGGSSEKCCPPGWDFQYLTTGGCELEVSRAVAHSGSSSVLVKDKKDHEDPGCAAVLAQHVRADAYRGKRVRVSAFLRTEGFRGEVALVMSVRSEQRQLGFSMMERRVTSAATDWGEYSVVLEIPADSLLFTFNINVFGNGRVWADSITVDVVPDSTLIPPGNGVRQGAPPFAPNQSHEVRDQYANAPAAPINLGFEDPCPEDEQPRRKGQ